MKKTMLCSLVILLAAGISAETKKGNGGPAMR